MNAGRSMNETVDTSASNRNSGRMGTSGSRWGLTIGLFVLAPLVSEYLLGVMSIMQLPFLIVLAPIYGGGALLIRETVRRFGLGWPGIIVLALAFAVVEEGLVLQTLFRPEFMGLQLIDYGYFPALGMGAWWTIYVLGIHSIWSIAVPIALMEEFAGQERSLPWLRTRWLAPIAVLFVLGSAANFHFALQEGSSASVLQLATAGIVVLALVGIATLPQMRGRSDPTGAARAPRPGVAGAVAFALGSAFMLLLLAGVLLGGAIPGLAVSGAVSDRLPAPVVVAAQLTVLATGAALLRRGSGRTGWSSLHVLAVAGGLLLTYAWYGLVQVMVSDTRPAVTVIGQCGFVLGAILLLWRAWRRAGGDSDDAPFGSRSGAVTSRISRDPDRHF